MHGPGAALLESTRGHFAPTRSTVHPNVAMRLWSLHPEYLDTQGLVALWREGLLAQQVLLGNTSGYRHHPQLNRFNASGNPVGAIATYLRQVAKEARRRGYNFDTDKISKKRLQKKLPVSDGQVRYEFEHLLTKLKARSSAWHESLKNVRTVKAHPLFETYHGDIESWEVRK